MTKKELKEIIKETFRETLKEEFKPLLKQVILEIKRTKPNNNITHVNKRAQEYTTPNNNSQLRTKLSDLFEGTTPFSVDRNEILQNIENDYSDINDGYFNDTPELKVASKDLLMESGINGERTKKLDLTKFNFSDTLKKMEKAAKESRPNG